jgi:7,8-dihydroneopterin aldolase/epimerase/oxygenase
MTLPPPAPPTTARPSRRVFVRDLEIMASVGIFEVEHRYEQRIVVSLTLDVLDTYDGHSEQISDVLDYSGVVYATEKLVQSHHFKLIETLAERLAELCLQDTRVLAATIKIEKPDIMPSCRAVGIEICRTRAHVAARRTGPALSK